MTILVRRLRKLWRRPGTPGQIREVDVRLSADLFDRVRAHVEDFSRGEEAGFLICSVARLPHRDDLLGREWLPIPDRAIARNSNGSVLSWSAEFNSEVLQRALDLEGTLVLVHSHCSAAPVFSDDDRAKEGPLFGPFSRLLDHLPTGTLLLGGGQAAGSFWLNGRNEVGFRRLGIVGETIEIRHPAGRRSARKARGRLDRQSRAIGPDSDAKLAEARVAVLGLSGGGSHVNQQLAHQGIGTLISVDDQEVAESNLGRLVGATEGDIDRTLKIDVAERVAKGIDSAIQVIGIDERFPSPRTIQALKDADVIVGCLDRFDAREGLNSFCRRYLIPLVDIGMTIRSSGEQLAIADGQLSVSVPGRPCLRCWFLTDAVLGEERQHRPPGYDQNPEALGEAQVVSMNGVLASEACNCVLDLLTGYSGGRRGAKTWQYEGRSGELIPGALPSSRPGCPACAEEGHADPTLE